MKKINVFFVILLMMMPNNTIWSQEAGGIAAVVTKIQGRLMFAAKGSDQWLYAKEGDFLNEGDMLKTGPHDLATITFVNGIEVKLNKQTKFNINVTEISDRGKGNAVSLSVGQAWSRILKEGTQFDIETPAATVAIRGSEGDTKVRKNGRTQFILYYGKAYVENEHGKVDMKPGSKTSITVGSAPEAPQIISETEEENWQDTLAGKPQLKLELEKTDVVVGYPVRVKVNAAGADGKLNKEARVPVRIGSTNEGIAFSKSKQGSNRSKALTVALKKGSAVVWAFPLESGSLIMTSQSPGYTSGMGRLYAFQPSKKNLELEIETEDGRRKTLKMKFRR